MTGAVELHARPLLPMTRGEKRAEFWFQVGVWLLVVAMIPDVALKLVDFPALRLLAYAGHFGPFLLAYAAWLSYFGSPRGVPFLTSNYRIWLALFIGWCVVLTARFFTLSQSHRFLLIIDLYPTLGFVAGVVLGGKLVHERTWDRTYMRTLIPGILLVLGGLSGIRTAVRDEAVSSEAYGLEVLVEPVLFLLLTLDNRKRTRDKYIIVITLVVYMLSQLLFQKRAPVTRIALFVGAFALLVPMVNQIAGLTRAIIQRYVLGVAGTLLFIFLAIIGPGRIEESTQALERRFQESSQDRYRQDEVKLLWDLLTPQEKVIGKGFGGYFIGLGLSTSIEYMPGVGTDVHAANHIGAFWSIFKGGLVLFVLLNLAYLGVALGVMRALSHPRLFACWFYVLVHVAFQGIETLWGQQHVLHVLLVGLCVGHFLASGNRQALAATTAPSPGGEPPATSPA
jgi:hypothetical protein